METPMTEDPQKSQIKKTARIIVSCSLPGGRRRAGYAFGTEPVEIPIDNLGKAQLEAIEADPALSTKRIT